MARKGSWAVSFVAGLALGCSGASSNQSGNGGTPSTAAGSAAVGGASSSEGGTQAQGGLPSHVGGTVANTGGATQLQSKFGPDGGLFDDDPARKRGVA